MSQVSPILQSAVSASISSASSRATRQGAEVRAGQDRFSSLLARERQDGSSTTAAAARSTNSSAKAGATASPTATPQTAAAAVATLSAGRTAQAAALARRAAMGTPGGTRAGAGVGAGAGTSARPSASAHGSTTSGSTATPQAEASRHPGAASNTTSAEQAARRQRAQAQARGPMHGPTNGPTTGPTTGSTTGPITHSGDGSSRIAAAQASDASTTAATTAAAAARHRQPAHGGAAGFEPGTGPAATTTATTDPQAASDDTTATAADTQAAAMVDADASAGSDGAADVAEGDDTGTAALAADPGLAAWMHQWLPPAPGTPPAADVAASGGSSATGIDGTDASTDALGADEVAHGRGRAGRAGEHALAPHDGRALALQEQNASGVASTSNDTMAPHGSTPADPAAASATSPDGSTLPADTDASAAFDAAVPPGVGGHTGRLNTPVARERRLEALSAAGVNPTASPVASARFEAGDARGTALAATVVEAAGRGAGNAPRTGTEARGGDVASLFGLAMPGSGAVNATGAASSTGAAGGTATTLPTHDLDATPGTPEFAPALAAQVTVFARDGVQQARLQLNPAELGPIDIRIAVDGQQAQIDFQADVAQTRQAIEAGLPELAGALREAGLTLTGGGVFQQPRDPSQAQAWGQGGNATGTGDGSQRGTQDGGQGHGGRGQRGGADDAPQPQQLRRHIGWRPDGVDLYA